MRKSVKNIAMTLCSIIMAVALVFGFVTFGNSAKADESLTISTLTMVDGASLKIDAKDPSLIFTANVIDYDSEATYGVLVVEENVLLANAITEDYFAKLDELGLAYEKITCTPFEKDGEQKIKAYFSVDPANFDVDYAGIGFIEKSGVYSYTTLTDSNVRNVQYVAEKALEEETFSAADEVTLKSWVDMVEGKEYVAGNTAAAINVDKMNVPGDNGAEIVSFITSTYFCGGSTVEFDIFVPTALAEHFESQGRSFRQCWISVCWTTDLNATDMYAHVDPNLGVDVNSQIIPGKWSHVSVVLPGESNMYVYISSAKNEWNGNSMLIDNFKVTEDGIEYLEDFEGDLEYVAIHGNPNAKVDGVHSPIAADEIVQMVEAPVLEGEAAVESGELALKYTFDVGMDEVIPFVSKQAFAAGSTVEFMYYVDAPAHTNGWLIWAWTDDLSKTPYYAQLDEHNNMGAYLAIETGVWKKARLTLPEVGGPYHVYFASSVGGWNEAGSQEAYVLFDNFTVNGELIEDFNDGVNKSEFLVKNAICVSNGEGYVVEEIDGEYAMKLSAATQSGYIQTATKVTFAGGSVISFKYYIPEGTTTNWWWTSYKSTTPDYDPNADYYDAPHFDNSKVVGEWTTMTITLPTTDPSYYIFFVFEDGNWSATYGDPYVLIDNFTVNGEVVETFNNGLGIFEERTSGVSLADGYVAPAGPQFPGEYGAELYIDSMTNEAGGDVGNFVTRNSYEAGTTISFMYYIPADVTPSYWWVGLASDPYSIPSQYEGQIKALSKDRVGEWVTVELTLENAGHIFIMGSISEWGGGYAVIDNFKVNGELVEDFNNGISAFIYNEDAVKLGAGHVAADEPEGPEFPGEYAMSYICNVSSETVSQVTKEAFAAGSKISFKYYIPAGTVTSWWGIAWSTSNSGLDIYATAGASGYQPGTVTGSWVDASFTLPAEGGPFYLYFGAEIGAAHGRWMKDGENATILIDDFAVDGVVVEDFNNGLEDSLFDVLVDDAVGLGEGYVYVAPEIPEDCAAKITIDLISGTATTPSFITKEKYVSDGTLVVTFDYYMSGNLGEKWWAFFWTNDNKQASIYAHVENNKENNDGRDLPVNVQDQWAKASVTIPAGEWYFYFGGSVGDWGRKDGEEGRGYVIIDNFKIGNLATEDFNNTNNLEDESDYGIFVDNRSSKPNAITLVEGKPADAEEPTPDPEPDPDPTPDPDPVEPGEHALKYTFNVGLDAQIPFITNEAFEAGSTVEFMYYIPAGASTSWWIWAWTDDTSKTPYYAQVDTPATGADLSKVTGEWTKVSVTLPAEGGAYYIYITSNVGGWELAEGGNAYVLIDNITVNGELVEDFNNGLEGSLITVVNDVCVSLANGEGYVAEEPTPDPIEPGEYSMKLWAVDQAGVIPNASNVAFAGGSEISFMYFIPAGTTTNWWWLSYTTTVPDGGAWTDYYNAPHIDLPQTTTGKWVEYTVTLPTEAESYYIFFVTEEGHWVGPDGATAYVLIDNVTVNGELVEDFNNGFEGSAFDARTEGVELGEGYVVAPFAPGEHAAEFDFSTNFDYVTTTFMTKEAVAQGGDVVTVQFYIPESTTVGGWWFLGWSTTREGADFWVPNQVKPVNGGLGLATTQGQWVTATINIPTDEEGYTYYLYVVGYEGWAGPVYMDNVVVTRNGEVEISEDFNGDPADWMFAINKKYVSYGDGYVAEEPTPDPEPDPDPTPDPVEPGEYAAQIFIDKIKPDAGIATFVTKDAYPAGTEISFMYYIPADVTSNWFAVLCIDTQEQADVYTDWLWQGNLVKGSWAKFTATLSKDGYIAIAGSVGDWGAKDDPKTEGYILIDNFTINGETDTFNNGLTAGLFDVNIDTAVVLGDGYVEEVVEYPGDYAVRIYPEIMQEGVAAAFVTKEAYPAGSTVTLRTYVSSASNASWWSLNYTTDPSSVSVYEPQLVSLSVTANQWRDRTVTLPADGGPYYIYVAGPIGEWKGGYGLIDNVVITTPDGTVYYDDFSNGIDAKLFNVNDENVAKISANGEGIDEPAVEEPAEPTPDPTPDPEMPEGEGYLVVDFKAFEEGRINLHTKQAYKNITEFYVDIYVPRVDTFDWYGFTPASAVSGKDAYFAACTSDVGLKTSMGYYGWYDQWVTVKYVVEDGVWKPYLIMRDGTTKHKDTWNADLSGADYVADGASYIILSANPARSYEWGMWIDNVRIVADGVTYEDTFSNGVSTLFDYSSAATIVYES